MPVGIETVDFHILAAQALLGIRQRAATTMFE